MGNGGLKSFSLTGPENALYTVENQYFVYGARGIACDPAGNIFVASESKNCIYQIEKGMLFSSTFAGHQGFRSGIAITAEGCMIICDSKNRAVRRMNKDGVVETLLSNLKSPPLEVVEDTTDGTFLITTQHGIIRCIPPEKRKDEDEPNHKLVAGLWGASGCNIGMASEARFRNPESITVLPSGAFLVADVNNNFIRKYTRKNGVVSAAAGNGQTTSVIGGPASAVSVAAPAGLAADSQGRVVFFDQLRSHVRVLDIAQDFISNPIVDFNSVTGGINDVNSCCIDKDGKIWFTSHSKNKVVCLAPTFDTPAPGFLVSRLPIGLNMIKQHEGTASNVSGTAVPSAMGKGPIAAAAKPSPVLPRLPSTHTTTSSQQSTPNYIGLASFLPQGNTAASQPPAAYVPSYGALPGGSPSGPGNTSPSEQSGFKRAHGMMPDGESPGSTSSSALPPNGDGVIPGMVPSGPLSAFSSEPPAYNPSYGVMPTAISTYAPSYESLPASKQPGSSGTSNTDFVTGYGSFNEFSKGTSGTKPPIVSTFDPGYVTFKEMFPRPTQSSAPSLSTASTTSGPNYGSFIPPTGSPAPSLPPNNSLPLSNYGDIPRGTQQTQPISTYGVLPQLSSTETEPKSKYGVFPQMAPDVQPSGSTVVPQFNPSTLLTSAPASASPRNSLGSDRAPGPSPSSTSTDGPSRFPVAKDAPKFTSDAPIPVIKGTGEVVIPGAQSSSSSTGLGPGIGSEDASSSAPSKLGILQFARKMGDGPKKK